MLVCTDKYNDEELRANLRKKLDPARYEHSLGVAYTACSLFILLIFSCPQWKTNHPRAQLHPISVFQTDTDRKSCHPYTLHSFAAPREQNHSFPKRARKLYSQRTQAL